MLSINTRLFAKLCGDIDSNPCRKLFFMWKGLLARVAESVFVWSRIPNNTRSRSRIYFVRLRLGKSNWIIFYILWYNFFNFFWNLLKQRIIAMYHDFHWVLLQNCWHPNFIRVMLRSRSRKMWKGRTFYLRPRNRGVDSGAPRVWQAWLMPWARLWRVRKNCLQKTKVCAAQLHQHSTLI